MNSTAQSKKAYNVYRQNEQLKSDITMLKQGQSTQRIQYEQMNNDQKNRLNAREGTIQELNAKLAEKDKMIEQFRRLHRHSGGGTNDGGNGGPGGRRLDGNNSIRTNASNNNHRQDDRSMMGGGNSIVDQRRHENGNISNFSSGCSVAASTAVEPPLKGIMMQRQAHQMAQQQAFAKRRGPSIPAASSAGMNNRMIQQSQHSMGQHTQQSNSNNGYSRPYSSNNSVSSNSLSSTTPRVRDLSHNTSFNFTGGSGSSISVGSSGNQRLNKRRRSDQAGTPAVANAMSPNTAFTLNQGAHTVNRGPRWLQRDGRSYSMG